MPSIRDFYVRSRGLEAITEDWKLDHDRLKIRVWPIEDLIPVFTDCARDAIQLFDEARLGGLPEETPFSLGEFIDQLEKFAATGREVLQYGLQMSDEYPLRGLDELRSAVEILTDIVNEDRFASDAAAEGLLDEQT